MQFIILQMGGSVASNNTFDTKFRFKGSKGDMVEHSGTYTFWYSILLYPMRV